MKGSNDVKNSKLHLDMKLDYIKILNTKGYNFPFIKYVDQEFINKKSTQHLLDSIEAKNYFGIIRNCCSILIFFYIKIKVTFKGLWFFIEAGRGRDKMTQNFKRK